MNYNNFRHNDINKFNNNTNVKQFSDPKMMEGLNKCSFQFKCVHLKNNICYFIL